MRAGDRGQDCGGCRRDVGRPSPARSCRSPATAGTIRSSRADQELPADGRCRRSACSSSSRPACFEDDGQPARGRARLHVGRRLRQAGRCAMVYREPRARAVAGCRRRRSGNRFAMARLPLARSVGVVGDERDDGVDQKAPTIVVLADDDVEFLGRRGDGPADAGLHDSQQPGTDRDRMSWTRSARQCGR